MADKKTKKSNKKVEKQIPETLKIVNERDIAMDFALKVYHKFDQMVKSIVLFGSSAKKKSRSDSDIDILIIIDDVTINWDMELIAWYREELAKLMQVNPYVRPLHINSIKLSTWWSDLLIGDPIVLNVIRWGDPLIDFGGFFNPLKVLLSQGRIRSTPEAIYTLLQRAPQHIARGRASLLAAVDGFYWTMIDSAHAAIISAEIEPSSPEDIPRVLYEEFVNKKMLNKKFVSFYEEIHSLAKDIIHGKRVVITGEDVDRFAKNAEEFLTEMTKIVDINLEEKKIKRRIA